MNHEKELTGDTRERILKAATEVFVEKGLAGARMQEIADHAGVNKAMLHYYFRSKEHLYESVITTTIANVMTEVRGVLQDEGLSFEERIARFIGAYFDALKDHTYMPRLVMQDLMVGGQRVVQYFRKAAEQAGFLGGVPVLGILEEGIECKELRKIDPKQAIVSLVSMVAFYFLGRPIFSGVLGLSDEDQKRFFEERKRHVTDLFLHGVMASPDDANSAQDMGAQRGRKDA